MRINRKALTINTMRERGLEPLWFNPLDPKGINRQMLHCLLVIVIIPKSIIINGFPVFLVSVGIGKNRSHSDHPGHKIDIKTKKHSFSPETPIPPDLLRVPSTPPVYISLPYKIDFPKHLGPGDRPGSRSIPRSSSLAWA